MTRIGFFLMAGAFSGFLAGMFLPWFTASIGVILGGGVGLVAGLLLDRKSAAGENSED